MSTHADETIAAVATPPGTGGIGIVRISGSEALAVGGRLFQGRGGRPLEELPPFRLCLGSAADPATGEQIDEVLAVWMPAGRSYTGEPTVEIHAHGGPAVLEALLRATCEAGARLAGPGDFTRRAFLSGRIDLSQAEAVADLIAAESQEERRQALLHLRGGMAGRVAGLRARLVELIAGTEALFDFGDEDAVGAEPSVDEMAALVAELRDLVAAGRHRDEARRGPQIVVAGATNSGKSSLFNRLLNFERSLVNQRPGTTRDYVSEQTLLGGTLVTLVDTAGLRASADPVEAEGIARSRALIAEADIVVLLVDGSEPARPDDLALIGELRGQVSLVVLSKSDLPQRLDADLLERACAGLPCLAVSARSGVGLPEFVTALATRSRAVRRDAAGEGGVAAPNLRQQQALLRAALSLEEAAGLASTGSRSLDLAAAAMREALHAVDEIVGRGADDEIIGRIFSRFCVGK